MLQRYPLIVLIFILIMKKPILLVLVIAICLRGAAQNVAPGDTLISGVSEWNKLKVHTTKYGESREVLTGNTHDQLQLTIYAYTLLTGISFVPGGHTPVDRLLIVKEGDLTIKKGDSLKVLGPGGIGLFPAGYVPELLNASTSNTTFYLFTFSGKGQVNGQRAKQAGGPVLIDWPEMVMKKTDKGESRPIFSRAAGWLGRIDLHATTLNIGQVSHPPHTHHAEEIILLRSGHVQEFINGNHEKASGGDLIFLASGSLHAVENHGNDRCEYFALQWEE